MVFGTVAGTVIIAPLVAALAVGIGVPILLAYVYGIVPISLCRSGGCGVTKNNNGGVRFAFDDENTDNLNFFNYNANTAAATAAAATSPPSATGTVVVETSASSSHKKKASKKKGDTSVKVPISAIESKSSQHEITDSAKSNTKKNLHTEGGLSQTPVLVLITIANKMELDNEAGDYSSEKLIARPKTKLKSKSSSSRHHASPTVSDEATKASRRSNLKTSFNIKSGLASKCGSVELLKLTKSYSTSSSPSEMVQQQQQQVASDCVDGTAAATALTANMMRASNRNNENNINLSSSSSSQHLLDNCGDEAKKLQHHAHKPDQVTNPSIGDVSIGALTSRSVSGSNLFDFEGKARRQHSKPDDQNDQNSLVTAYIDNASHIAIASSSINDYSIKSFPLPGGDPKEACSVSTNPSVTALAGSIK